MDKQLSLAHVQSRLYRQTPDFNISKDQVSKVGSLSETVKYQHRSVLPVDPYVRCIELAKTFSATLTELTTKERQLSLEYTINAVNESVVEPKLHISFASSPPPLEDWKEQFIQLRNDPEIKKAKRKIATNIFKENMSERVLDQLRCSLPRGKFDQLKRKHSYLQGRNPLIRLIDATEVVGDVSPKTLVNAIKNAGYRKAVINFSHLINPTPRRAGNDLTFQQSPPHLTRNDTGRQSWPSRDSACSSNLNRSSSFRRESSTSIYPIDTSSSNENNTLKLQRLSVCKNKTVEQKKPWQLAQPVYSAAPFLADAGNYQGSHSCSQDIHKATPSDAQPDVAKEFSYEDQFSLKNHHQFPQFYPSTGTNTITSRYSLTTTNDPELKLATATTDPVSKLSRLERMQPSTSPENIQKEIKEKLDTISQRTMTLNQKPNSLSTIATSGYSERVAKSVGDSTCTDTKPSVEKYATLNQKPIIRSDDLCLTTFRADSSENLFLPLSTLDQQSGGHYWTSSLDCAEYKTLRRGSTLHSGYSVYKRKEEEEGPSA